MHNGGQAEHAPIRDIVGDIRTELKEFVQTRVRLAGSELSQVGGAMRRSAIAAVIAGVLLLTGYLWLVLAVTALIADAFASWQVGWPAAFAIMGVALAVLGGTLLLLVKVQLKQKPLLPARTLQVLKADARAWGHDGNSA
jgi:uncharacterized membrane protein YqjE